ncbi:MAG: bifunctional glutamate N-acetyltransferase/amino-acid acetyltransferase ArgJ [Trueperaceae bacterium]|nr:MAG: bifunctional glutamate N-acetyltransferase/amino-acid acetyltransferase ArgJ [Trueperaceae bacterium]
MKLPNGFQSSGIVAGLKASSRPDLGLIYSSQALSWAMTSTTNSLKAPCVSRNRARYATDWPVRGLVVNSGNANCANGDQGIWDNEDFAGAVATSFGLPRVQDILTASTGIIGEKLPVEKITQAIPELIKTLEDDSSNFAEAILTTDTRTKQVAATLRNGVRIVGIAKGSGMIHPTMATMLAFVMTDADLPQGLLRELWPEIVNRSFNQVSVDGDTSPNDMAILLSSNHHPAAQQEFSEALEAVCQKLAEKIAADGEGASKLITVRVRGARTVEEARTAARQVAKSSLVKAAIHGNDPNWGRILSAVGTSGAVADQSSVLITLQGTVVYHGSPQDFEAAKLSSEMRENDVEIEINLAAGNENGIAWGCDLGPEYVHINADYHT